MRRDEGCHQVLWGLVLVVGLLGRAVFSLATPLSQLSSDEAHTGIQALEALRGNFWVFVPGTPYGGNLEGWIDAPFALLLGASALRLKLLFSALWLIAAVAASRSVRGSGSTAALVAFAVLWVPSAPLLLHSTLAYPGYAAGLVASCAALVFAVGPLDEDRGGRRALAGLGAAAGLATWMHPFFLLAVIPPVVAVAWRRRKDARALAALAAGGIAALALPVIANVRSGFASLQPSPSFPDFTYTERLMGILGDLFARAVGARWTDNARACRDGPWTCDGLVGRADDGLDDRWTLGPAGPIVTVLLLGLLFGAIAIVLRRGTPLGRACAGGLLCAPFGMALLSQSAYTQDARYASMLLPLAAVVAAQAIQRLTAGRSTFVVGAAVLTWMILALAVPALVRLPPLPVDPDADLKPVLTVLRENRITAVRAEYWIAYRLTYATGEVVTASPIAPVKFDRYEGVVRRAEQAGTAAMVLQRRQAVPVLHPPRLVEAGAYLVFLPSG